MLFFVGRRPFFVGLRICRYFLHPSYKNYSPFLRPTKFYFRKVLIYRDLADYRINLVGL
ncbi:TPA_asm: hypothetical protein [Porphyromonas phage phage016a_WW2866]|uniref:Uncharacterized protein n=1 Tax=Porphyromonas phage phage016a_WW2866 TaxID=3154106 RepID=A0AAT9JBU3_9CAUD